MANYEPTTNIPSEVLSDCRISLKAKGLLAVLLSLPNKDNLTEDYIHKILNNDGQTAIRTALKELELAGYLRRARVRDSKGRIVKVEWTILV